MHGTRARVGRHAVIVSLVAVGLTLGGCGEPDADSPVAPDGARATSPDVRSTELSDAGGEPCPDQLPLGDDPSGHGFGVETGAAVLPNLLDPDEAWVCGYHLVEQFETDESGDLVVSGGVWVRDGDPEAIAPEDLPDLRAALEALSRPDPEQACTSDLGPRWLVTYVHDGDLTGVVVDNFGCSSVRLTDNPHVTPPGDVGQEGTTGGVFDGGHAILDALGLGGP